MSSDNRIVNMGSENVYNIVVLIHLRNLHQELIFLDFNSQELEHLKCEVDTIYAFGNLQTNKLFFPCPCAYPQ